MWHESQAGIAELMSSSKFTDNLEPGTINSKQWAKYNIIIEFDVISRDLLFDMAETARKSDSDEDHLRLFWHVLAGGVMGNFRNAGQIAQSAQDDAGCLRLAHAVRTASLASYSGDIAGAFRAFAETKINRLGPAFFTKILYFAGNRESLDPRCLIFDAHVESARPTITGLSYSSTKRTTDYVRYCTDVHTWAERYDTTPDAVEGCLYQLGQLTGDSRRAWLSAEVSLYRDGLTPVTFDRILERLMSHR